MSDPTDRDGAEHPGDATTSVDEDPAPAAGPEAAVSTGAGGSGSGGDGGDVVVGDAAGGEDRPPGVEPIEIQTEMEQSFLDYAMSVIVSRALPDARDGLKPVHRRILWSMYDAGFRPGGNHVKCARVVGDVMGNYHPHGDQAIYDALVRMGQSFSLRHPLIDPQGNFGSPADEPAAMRYTEARLTDLALRMLEGIDQDTVDFGPNYDANHQEPLVLPARFPNLLVNGQQGIAVGMATNIPPHNLGEVIDAVHHLLAHPEAGVDELMGFVKGPDFPTGGLIMGRQGIADAYQTGRGSIRVRALAEIVEDAKSNEQIVVTELPYQTSAEALEAKIADVVERKVVDGVRAIHNESAKGATRMVIELKRDASGLVVLNNLYRHTPLQISYPVNMVALVDGVPRTLDLRSALVAYVDHQIEVVTRRSEHRLAKARRDLHINQGLLRALALIDAIIATIRASENRAGARTALEAEPFEFSEVQANYILDMQLGTLTRLGREQIEGRVARFEAEIAELTEILGDDTRLRAVIAEELTDVRDTFATPRRSQLTVGSGDIDLEDLIDDEELIVTLTRGGYVRATSPREFRLQGRGGRGVAGANLRDDDVVWDMLHTTAHAYLLFFSNRGKVYRIKAHEIPMRDRTARGTALVNLLPLAPDERVQAVIDTRDYETSRYLMFATRRGVVKKTLMRDYDSSRRDGLIALALRDDDELVQVLPTGGDDDVLLVASSGQTLRFAESDVRPMGRVASGVRGMNLRGDDVVVACAAVRPDTSLVTITDLGYGKRTEVQDFPRRGRGTMGVIGMRLDPLRGRRVVAALLVHDDDELVLVSSGGVLIRTRAGDVSLRGRSTGGVRVMNLDDDDRVAAVAPVAAVGPADDPDLDGPGADDELDGPGADDPDLDRPGADDELAGPVDERPRAAQLIEDAEAADHVEGVDPLGIADDDGPALGGGGDTV